MTAGVYCFDTSAILTAILTLDGQDDVDTSFVFEVGSTLTTATAAAVTLNNGAVPCNVYFAVGSSPTLDTGTVFAGNIIAMASISLDGKVRIWAGYMR